MKTFQNNTKIIFRLFKITAIVIALICLTSCDFYYPFIIPYNSVTSYTKDEFMDMYWEHKDELSEVAEIVLASDSLKQRIRDNNEIDWAIHSDSVKDDFSEEDWEKIVDLYEKIRPVTIMRALRKNDDVVYIRFYSIEEDGSYIDSLFYFKNAETAEAYKGYSWVGELEHLDGYWYVEEEILSTCQLQKPNMWKF